MVFDRFVVGAFIFGSLFIGAGCQSQQTPAEPVAQTHARKRPALPTVPPMGQCVDRPDDKDFELEVLDDTGIVMLSADPFVDLDPNERVVAYHLSRAAVAGAQVIYEQRSRFGGKVKALAEALALHRQVVPASLGPKVDALVLRVFINKGVYDARTDRKVPMPLDADELQDALSAALKDGATLPGVNTEKELSKFLAELRPLLFDPEFEPMVRPSAGKPYVQFAEPLKRMVSSLRKAANLASKEHAAALEQLAKHVESGSQVALDPDLPASTSSSLAVQLGFERRSGEFFAAVLLDDKSSQPSMDRLGAVWPPLQRSIRPGVARPSALRAVIPLTLSGTVELNTPPVVALSESAHPARSWVLTPVLDVAEKIHSKAILQEFLPETPERQVFNRCLSHAYRTRLILRETLGRAALNQAPSSNVDLVVIRQALAELVALVASWDPHIVEAGLLPDTACARVVDALVPADHLLQLRGVPSATAIHDPNVRASSLIVRSAVAKGLVREVTQQGHIQLQIVDEARWRAHIRSLLSELLDIDAKADAKKARGLLGQQGDELVARWRDSAVARSKTGPPSRIVFVAPRLKAIRNADGDIIDATLIDSLSVVEAALVDAGMMDMP